MSISSRWLIYVEPASGYSIVGAEKLWLAVASSRHYLIFLFNTNLSENSEQVRILNVCGEAAHIQNAVLQ